MHAPYSTTASTRTVWVADVLVVVWTVTWIVLAVLIRNEIRNLNSLSDTVGLAGTAVKDTGAALHDLEALPFVGEQIGRVADQIDAAGDSAVASAGQSRQSISRLSVLLTIAVAVIPTVPVVAAYAPFRVSRFREIRAVRRAAAKAGNDPAFQEFLARRAAENLPFHRLREVTPNAWRDLESGRYGPLAEAELRRLGLRPRADEESAERSGDRTTTDGQRPREEHRR
jgi:hypothetical protein